MTGVVSRGIATSTRFANLSNRILLRRTRGSVMQDLPPRTNEIVRIRPSEEQLLLNDEHCAKAARIASKPVHYRD